ncbi:MAG: hypothetical protein ABSG07_20435 [Terriglobales bacterium]|jgi:hypothetical protein
MSKESKRSVFEWCTQVIIPILATIAIFFQLQQRTVALSLVALAVVSVLIGGVPQVLGILRRRRLRKKEESVAATSLDSLKKWIHRFHQFANTDNNNTLYSIIFSKLCQSNQADFDRLLLPPLQLFGRVLGSAGETQRFGDVTHRRLQRVGGGVQYSCRLFLSLFFVPGL